MIIECRSVSPSFVHSKEGATPLLIAADMGDIEPADTGEQGCPADTRGEVGPYIGLQFGNLEMIKYLWSKALASISSDEIKVNDRTTPIHCMAKVGHCHVIKFLINGA